MNLIPTSAGWSPRRSTNHAPLTVETLRKELDAFAKVLGLGSPSLSEELCQLREALNATSEQVAKLRDEVVDKRQSRYSLPATQFEGLMGDSSTDLCSNAFVWNSEDKAPELQRERSVESPREMGTIAEKESKRVSFRSEVAETKEKPKPLEKSTSEMGNGQLHSLKKSGSGSSWQLKSVPCSGGKPRRVTKNTYRNNFLGKTTRVSTRLTRIYNRVPTNSNGRPPSRSLVVHTTDEEAASGDRNGDLTARSHEPLLESSPEDAGQGCNCSGSWVFMDFMPGAPTFEHTAAILVLINAVCLGYSTDYKAKHPHSPESEFVRFTERFFLIAFTTEWVIRVLFYRFAFFTMDGWQWNCMDTGMVISQWMENLSYFDFSNLSVLRMVRILRVLRIVRLLRVLHLFDELRTITASIAKSTTALAWSMLLLALTVYIFSVVFLGIVLEAGDTPHHAELHAYFGTLFGSCLTMFESIVGGINWGRVVTPLMTDISPVTGLIFSVYVSGSLIVLMNLLTGTFVDSVMSAVREDKDMALASRIRELFFNKDGETEMITYDQFEIRAATEAMREYFKQINLEPEEARNLFDFLDTDNDGCVDAEELVDGCLKLRGPARALELCMLMQKSGQVFEVLMEFQERTTKELIHIRRALCGQPDSSSASRDVMKMNIT